jgi:acyl-CoA synthetase (AMP-forming)/AMP-acid ligase II
VVVGGGRSRVSIPEIPLTDFVLGDATARGDKPALIDGPTGQSITYEGLAQSVGAVAGGLAARGFAKGDVLAIYCPNSPEYAVAFHAAASLGGINTTINPLNTAGELAAQLNDSSARFLLTIPQLMEAASSAAGASKVEEIFVFGEAPGATSFASLASAGVDPPKVDIDPRKDVVALPYSSGTTGGPKGVMLTHFNLVANLCQTEAVLKVKESDTAIGILPFFHIYGMTVIMNSVIHRGATVVTMPRFDLEQFLATLQDHRVTRAYLVPPIVLALAKHPAVDNYDLSALQLIMSGAAPLGADLSEACAQRLGCLVIQGYGLTETSPVTHINDEDPDGNKPGSIGPVVPNTEAMVVDPQSGAELTSGDRGEVWIRGPQVMLGYLNNPDATAATVDKKGWLRTGDVGYFDIDGYFFLVDRLKELIKYKGYQVAPAELEALLVSHPSVADAAVVPAADEEAGEVPRAFVVKRDDVSAEELMGFVAERVAPYKKIRYLEFIDEIPKSASGKILRRFLRDRAPA